jgi:putative transposase
VSRECLDHLLILSQRHLGRVLREYSPHYNGNRPHRGLALAVPEPSVAKAETNGAVRRRDALGGLIHEYYGEAA